MASLRGTADPKHQQGLFLTCPTERTEGDTASSGLVDSLRRICPNRPDTYWFLLAGYFIS